MTNFEFLYKYSENFVKGSLEFTLKYDSTEDKLSVKKGTYIYYKCKYPGDFINYIVINIKENNPKPEDVEILYSYCNCNFTTCKSKNQTLKAFDIIGYPLYKPKFILIPQAHF